MILPNHIPFIYFAFAFLFLAGVFIINSWFRRS